MTTKKLSERARAVIDGYLHIRVGTATCSAPYFNNKTVQARAALPVHVGKGSPKEIAEEAEAALFKSRIDLQSLSDVSLKAFLADHSIGIDCSGFAYHVLSAESEERGKGALDKHISLPGGRRFMARLLHALKPVKNSGVAQFAADANSRIVSLASAEPGDMITMIEDPHGGNGRNHILVIHEVEHDDAGAAKVLRYSDAVAYPEDGLYGSGVKQGSIEITDPAAPVTDQLWTEAGTDGGADHILARAKRSATELRRLRWF